MTFRLANVSGRAALVAPGHDGADQWYDLARLTDGRLPSDPMGALEHPTELHAASATLDPSSADGSFDDALDAGHVGPPVPRPTNCFGIGLNYRSHAEETGAAIPDRPLVFSKLPGCLVGPRADVELGSTSTDWEVELVVVIGRGGRNIPASHAWEHVLGVTAGQDVSDRELQYAGSIPHFDLGKSRDTYGPTGPVLVSLDALADPSDLALTCHVNGVRRQADRTSNLIVDIPSLVEYLSGILTLRTGDLVFTGTPAGVGAARREFLVPGDVITSHIDGIGSLVNHCRPATA